MTHLKRETNIFPLLGVVNSCVYMWAAKGKTSFCTKNKIFNRNQVTWFKCGDCEAVTKNFVYWLTMYITSGVSFQCLWIQTNYGATFLPPPHNPCDRIIWYCLDFSCSLLVAQSLFRHPAVLNIFLLLWHHIVRFLCGKHIGSIGFPTWDW